jgi:ABC-2 type transport system ATP-binding protein
VGYVADGEVLPAWATLEDLASFERRLRESWDNSAMVRWMGAERLTRWFRVRDLSRGQRKRFEIELALASRPAVLLLDEPFAGIDPVAKSEILQALLGHVAETGASVLLSSHVLPDLERVCDHVGVLADGRVATVVAMDELKESGGIVLGPNAGAGDDLPVELRVLAKRREAATCTWCVTGLDDDRRSTLARAGFQVVGGTLEEIGTELIRALDIRPEDRHV